MNNVKFWYSARNFDSCSKGELKFENGSVLRINISPRIKLSFPKLIDDVEIPLEVFEKMDKIISNNIYKYSPESSSKDQFEHGIQALFNVIGNSKNVKESFSKILNYKIIPNEPK